MKVAVSVHGRFHAFQLAAGLHERGLLAKLLTTYPAPAVRRFVPQDMPLTTAPLIELGRRLSEWSGVGGGVPVWVARQFGSFAARNIPTNADIFVGWSGASLEAIRCAKRRAIATVLERGSTHILHQNQVLLDAQARWGAPARPPEPDLIDRELEEYETADVIMVPTNIAAATFVRHGISQFKVLVNPYGIDLTGTGVPDRRRSSGPVRILFVGSVGMRKGIPSLLEAFVRLQENCELHLVGPVEDELRPLLSRGGARVIAHGPRRGPVLAKLFDDADIFCLPSIEEGFGLVLLQAMARGLPIVTTSVTGASMMAGEEDGVLMVSPGDDEALADALLRLASDSELRLAMGKRARSRVELDFTSEGYVDRAVQMYRRLSSSITSPEKRPRQH